MIVIPAMYLPFLIYAAWMGMVLRPFMQRVDDTFGKATLDADESPDMRILDQTVAPDLYRPSHHQ
jgi:hypothetical protein